MTLLRAIKGIDLQTRENLQHLKSMRDEIDAKINRLEKKFKPIPVLLTDNGELCSHDKKLQELKSFQSFFDDFEEILEAYKNRINTTTAETECVFILSLLELVMQQADGAKDSDKVYDMMLKTISDAIELFKTTDGSDVYEFSMHPDIAKVKLPKI